MKNIFTVVIFASITFAIVSLSSCGQKDDDDPATAAPTGAEALTINLNANCDGEPCF